MGVNKKTDGRYIVGMGAPNENEYKGAMGWRDIFIQLTENGATPDSEEKLAFLRDYAIYHNGEGNAIMPPSVSVWVSNNGVTSAVNADDITLEDGTYTICGIKWDGSSWDYTNAGQSSGGGGGSSIPSFTSSDVGKVLTVGEQAGEPVELFPEQVVTGSEDNPEPVGIVGANISLFVVGATVNLTVTDTTLGRAYHVTGTVVEHSGMVGFSDESTNISLFMQDNEMVIIIANNGTFSVTATVNAPATVAPVWKTAGGGVYLVHVDIETGTIVEDIDEVYSAIERMPVFLINPDGSGLIPILGMEGKFLVGYTISAIAGSGSVSSKLKINKITISNTGNITPSTFTVDITLGS